MRDTRGADMDVWALRAAASRGVPDVVFGQPALGRWRVGMGAEEALTGDGPGSGIHALRDARARGGTWLGGARFVAGNMDGAWQPLGGHRWVKPAVTWTQDGEQRQGPGGTVASLDVQPNRVVERHQDRAGWDARHAAALAAMERGDATKIVLARTIDLVMERPVDVVAVLLRLASRFPTTNVFMHRAPDGSCFLGATPETLCRWQGREFHVDALAGSAAGDDAFTDKERREHAWVVDDIRARLQPFASAIHADATPRTMALPNIRHLHTPVMATLRDDVDPVDVAAVLHPTPAVGGTPRDRALAFLAAHEGMDRGWYAGPVGFIDGERGHLAVALRCALVKGNRARLFVGAGLVAGSQADAEWTETERKGRVMLDALSGGAA